jgi:hypothetical protein
MDLDKDPWGYPMYYNRKGEPITQAEWIKAHGDGTHEDFATMRRVRETDIGPYWVSTVWLGLNHNYAPTGPPLIFETMVFLREGEADVLGLEDDCYRYSTEADAQQGHDEVVALIGLGLQLEAGQ